ncbi:MAG: hypothetical protein EKK64_03145, partial [Neisseriaceae bacterium]
MATSTLYPNGAAAFSSGTITFTGGSSNYLNLSDASDSSYMTTTGSNSYVCFPLTDVVPSGTITVTGVTITVRASHGSKGDYGSLDYVQILKSDGSTAITSTGTAATTTTATNYAIVPSTIYYTDATSWNGAVLKLKQNVGTGTGATWYEAKVDVTYTITSGTVTDTYNSGSGNWTVPAGITSVQIELWGGGGGGGSGGAGSGANGASGGGGGAYCKKTLTVTPGQTISYTVGSGGTKGTNEGNGGNGGSSTANSGAYTAGGGYGGLGGEDDNTIATLGGTATGGDINTTGGSSTPVASGNNGGKGGDSPNGGTGGIGGVGGLVGANGNAPGGGGGGGSKTDSDGGTGASGRVSFSYTIGSSVSYGDPSGISSGEGLGTNVLASYLTG